MDKLDPEEFVSFLEDNKSRIIQIEKNVIMTAYLSLEDLTAEGYYESIQNQN